jgi:histidinol-phosphate aminotransferase
MKRRLFNRNEVIQGPSPEALQAIRKFDSREASLYFDGYYGSSLAPELAQRFNIARAQVSVGYGIEFFLRAIFDSLDPERDSILTNEPHYGYYSAYANAKKISLTTFQILDRGDHFEFDIDDCVAKIKKYRPKVVLITSPNNPTGNSMRPDDLGKIMRSTRATQSLVVLDEAYWGFDPKYDEAATMRLLKKYENLVILRGFSKRYALAGLRIGFALWGKSAKKIIRYDDLYLGGSPLLEAVAVAALKSESYYANLSKAIIAERKQFIARVGRLKSFTPYASNANFVMVKIGAKALSEFKKREAKLPVAISKFTTPQFIRVSLGFHKDVEAFIVLLESIDKKYA